MICRLADRGLLTSLLASSWSVESITGTCTCAIACGLSLHKRSRLHFVRGSREEAARVAEEAKNHFETGRRSDSDGFSARHSSREYGYYEQFRGFRSGPERHYE